MFTGLVQDRGRIEGVGPVAGGGLRLSVRTVLAEALRLGDSLSVNGVCLTAEQIDGALVTATVVAETLAKTTTGQLGRGDRVNLEPALRVGDPLGGHIVQGHVDGVAVVRVNGERDGGWILQIELPVELQRYAARKGSIALDGVSLTVADVSGAQVTVALVPHTLEQTVLRDRRVGQQLNVEVDVLAKYVERLVGQQAAGADGPRDPSGLNEQRLRDLGY